MNELKVRLEFLSYWQTGSGEGLRPDLDAVCHRDADGLPFFPGRTFKGLWREAMQVAEGYSHLPKEMTAQLFGTGDYSPRPGTSAWQTESMLYFSDLVLEPEIRRWLCREENKLNRQELFRSVAFTALDNGVARKGSLRNIEVCIPLTLHGTVSLPKPTKNKEWKDHLRKTAGLIRAAGYRRHCGLGRCQVRVID